MNAIRIHDLSFAFGECILFDRLSLEVPSYSRCLLLGANGVGKSTLLRIIAGRHLVPAGSVEVMGHDPFSGGLSQHDFTLVGERFPLELDLAVSELLDGARRRAPAISAAHERELMVLLGVDPSWRMHRVSNGQRRRVDLLLSLLHRPGLVLLDEVTAELDILARQKLMQWFRQETLARRMTVVFATHILDGMQDWATHVAFLSPRRLRVMAPLAQLPHDASLLGLCEKWMSEGCHVEE